MRHDTGLRSSRPEIPRPATSIADGCAGEERFVGRGGLTILKREDGSFVEAKPGLVAGVVHDRRDGSWVSSPIHLQRLQDLYTATNVTQSMGEGAMEIGRAHV